MCHRLLFVLLPILLRVSSIKVPVNNEETATEIITVVQENPQSTPVYYVKDNVNLDSYLVQPDSHKTEESFPDGLETPATYLIPPIKEQQSQFYSPGEPSAQSDWLPILQAPPQNKRVGRFQRPPLESLPIFFNTNQPAQQQEGNQFTLPIPIPSSHLVPPSVDAVNEFFLPIPKETEIHVDEHNQPINAHNLPIYNVRDVDKVKNHLETPEPTFSLHLTPPKQQQAINIPTKLYPKKYSGDFKPVLLPLNQFSDEKEQQIPKAKPVQYFRPQPTDEIHSFKPSDEKNVYHFKKAENKRKLKGDEEGKKEHQGDVAAETYGRPVSTEQETSETNFRYPGRKAYLAPLRQAPASVPPREADPSVAPAPDGRTEFRMHGMKGPHSYQFGYDTGKGKNRQFRYEERDNDGLVHGHYGYVDKVGKLRVVNYSAHPEYGFRAEEPVTKE